MGRVPVVLWESGLWKTYVVCNNNFFFFRFFGLSRFLPTLKDFNSYAPSMLLRMVGYERVIGLCCFKVVRILWKDRGPRGEHQFGPRHRLLPVGRLRRPPPSGLKTAAHPGRVMMPGLHGPLQGTPRGWKVIILPRTAPSLELSWTPATGSVWRLLIKS